MNVKSISYCLRSSFVVTKSTLLLHNYLNQKVSGLLCCTLFVVGQEPLHSPTLSSLPMEYKMKALPRGMLNT